MARDKELEAFDAAVAARKPRYRIALERERAAAAAIARLRLLMRTEAARVGETQEKIAWELGVSQSAVSKLLTGSGDIGVGTVVRYCMAMGVEPGPLLLEAASPKENPMPEQAGAASAAFNMKGLAR